MSNETPPALGGRANDTGGVWAGWNVVHETQLLRERLLEPPRRPLPRLLIIAVVVALIVLIAAASIMFTMLS